MSVWVGCVLVMCRGVLVCCVVFGAWCVVVCVVRRLVRGVCRVVCGVSCGV